MANTLIGIQEQYIETLNAGLARWSHRKDGGHSSRISRGARHAAEKQLRKLGFADEKQITQIIQDARDGISVCGLCKTDLRVGSQLCPSCRAAEFYQLLDRIAKAEYLPQGVRA